MAIPLRLRNLRKVLSTWLRVAKIPFMVGSRVLVLGRLMHWMAEMIWTKCVKLSTYVCT